MAEAPIIDTSTTNTMTAPSSAANLLSRNDDAWVRELRSDAPFDMDVLVGLHRQTSPSHADAISVGTRSTSVWSSHKPSTDTKPTSAGTSYPLLYKQGEGSGVPTYSSSLSATDGSVSDNEPGFRSSALDGIGAWVPTENDPSNSPRGGRSHGRGRVRALKPKWKKPLVVLHQQDLVDSHKRSKDQRGPVVERNPEGSEEDTNCLRQRTKLRDDLARTEDVVQVKTSRSHESSASRPMTGARLYSLILVIIAIAATIAVSIAAAHNIGKTRMICTEGTIFSAMVILFGLTVTASLLL